jgi:hypothetical protein
MALMEKSTEGTLRTFVLKAVTIFPTSGHGAFLVSGSSSPFDNGKGAERRSACDPSGSICGISLKEHGKRLKETRST